MCRCGKEKGFITVNPNSAPGGCEVVGIMEGMMEHTPTPWEKERPYMEPHIYLSGPNTQLIACLQDNWENNKANAKHIVHCVNLHDELVEALSLTIRTIYDCMRHYLDNNMLCYKTLEGLVEEDLKPTLSKAKGE